MLNISFPTHTHQKAESRSFEMPLWKMLSLENPEGADES